MFSQVTRDRLKAVSYFAGSFIIAQTTGFLALSSIRSALSKNSFQIMSQLKFNSSSLIESLAGRAFVIVGASFITFKVLKLVCCWLDMAWDLSHIDLNSRKWNKIAILANKIYS